METCPKDRCNAFEVFKGEYFCLPKDETPECGMYVWRDDVMRGKAERNEVGRQLLHSAD